MFVLDTNVLSEIRKTHADRTVVSWVRGHHDDLMYTTAMNIYEIKKGILSVPASDSRQISMLDTWLTKILTRFQRRVLPMEAEAAVEAAEIGRQTNIEMKDCVIGAIANQHDMTVVTRNTKHLSKIAHRVVNPWEASDD